MINKTGSSEDLLVEKEKLPEVIHSVLHYKYSQQLIRNFQLRAFSQFIKPTNHYQLKTSEQIKGIDFLSFCATDQCLIEYNDLAQTIGKIRSIILTRLNSDYCLPLHFHGNYFHFHLRYLRQHPKYRAIKSINRRSTEAHLTEELFLNQKQPVSSKKESLTVCTPKEKCKEKIKFFKEQMGLNDQSTLQDGSMTLLEKIHRDLSIMIKKISDSKQSIDITACLNQMKDSIKLKKHNHIKFIKKEAFEVRLSQLEEKNSSEENQEEEEEEMYGLRKYKQKASSNEKRIKKKFSQEKSKNKKNKIHNPSTSQYKRKKNIESPVLVREDLERKNFLRKHNISLKKKKSELRLSKSKLCIRK